jgi:hypothetical protein
VIRFTPVTTTPALDLSIRCKDTAEKKPKMLHFLVSLQKNIVNQLSGTSDESS